MGKARNRALVPIPNNLWPSDGLFGSAKLTLKEKQLPGWKPRAAGQASLSPGQIAGPGPFVRPASNDRGPTMCQEHRALDDQR